MSARMPYDTYDNDDQGLFTNRSTMMANFEEWIKMATDNKINSRNSWNFALIDYFHDLNVLRDSENNINFQKASATLDGCVKIYSSRVDSVTTETGKLLSGLAQKKVSDKQRDNGENDGNRAGSGNDKEDIFDEDAQIDPSTGLPIANDLNGTHTKRRVHNRVLETTLVDFDTIKLKELDQELNIDPLFKKALVDFDEGGAKSLLLNTLNIDRNVRVVFDTALRDTKENDTSRKSKDSDAESDEEDQIVDDSASMANVESIANGENTSMNADVTSGSIIIEDEILALGMDYIKFEDISNCVISPSMQELPKVVQDITRAKTFLDGVNSKFDNFLSEKELQEAVPDLGPDGIEDDNNGLQDGYHDDQQADIDGFPYGEQDENEDGGTTHGVDDNESSALESEETGIAGVFEQDLMAYFDENLTKTWRGREHWKVRNLKKNMAKGVESTSQEKDESGATEEAIKKKKKAPVQIDFFALDDKLEETIFASKKRTNIELPQKSRTNASHYLLPDDFHFTTQKVTRLFIKPQQTVRIFQSRRNKRPGHQAANDSNLLRSSAVQETNGDKPTSPIADEQFWAENYERVDRENDEEMIDEPESIINEGPENPFEEEDGVDFNQAFEDEEIKDDDPNQLSPDGPAKFSLADNKVNYSRVSKKVDVKKLKDHIWYSIKTLANNLKNEMTDETNFDRGSLTFREIAVEISKQYKVEARKDISTSFCFICLLHLANEHGLKITSTDDYEDLTVEFEFASLQI